MRIYNEEVANDLAAKIGELLNENQAPTFEAIIALTKVKASACMKRGMIFEEYKTLEDVLNKCLEETWPTG
jgi:hypothetical protein